MFRCRYIPGSMGLARAAHAVSVYDKVQQQQQQR
jgi:hypothetical protein